MGHRGREIVSARVRVIVLLIALSFAAGLAWGVARVGRGERDQTIRPPRASVPPTAATPLPS